MVYGWYSGLYSVDTSKKYALLIKVILHDQSYAIIFLAYVIEYLSFAWPKTADKYMYTTSMTNEWTSDVLQNWKNLEENFQKQI